MAINLINLRRSKITLFYKADPNNLFVFNVINVKKRHKFISKTQSQDTFPCSEKYKFWKSLKISVRMN